MIPAYNVPYDWQNGAVQMAEAYYQLGKPPKADEMMKALADKAVEYLTWYLSLDDNRFMISTREFEYHWAVLDAEVKDHEEVQLQARRNLRSRRWKNCIICMWTE